MIVQTRDLSGAVMLVLGHAYKVRSSKGGEREGSSGSRGCGSTRELKDPLSGIGE